MRSSTVRTFASLLLLWARLASAAVVETSLGALPATPSLGVAVGVPGAVSVAPLSPAAASLVLPVAAPSIPSAVVPESVASPLVARALPAVAAPVPSVLAPRAASETEADAAAFFDGASSRRDLTPAQALTTEFPGVTFQNEQEGNLFHGDLKDSSGDVFAYYRPAELRGDLLEKARARMDGLDRFGMAMRTWRGLLTRGDPLKTWNALPRTGKIYYLALLEEAVRAERGAGVVWQGKRFLLLERSPAAPDFVAEHPDMEDPPGALREGLGARFLQPEIVSHKERAARTGAEAVARTRRVIADTAHAGTQYHAFLTMPTRRLLEAMPGLSLALQAYNDLLFLEAAADSPDNLLHGSLRPWHAGRSARVRELVEGGASEPHQPRWDDADSEKHAFVGLRYWGAKDGLTTVSIELRGTAIPWKRQGSAAMRGVEGAAPEAKRDYSSVERSLGQIALIADRLRNGSLPVAREAPLVLDAQAAAKALSARSVERAAPAVTVADLEALSVALGGGPGVHPALLYPLARGGSDAYAAELWKQVMTLKAQGGEFNARLARYALWSEFAEWARPRIGAARSRVDALAR